MDAPITREELVEFARQVLLLAFFAGVIGAMSLSVVASCGSALFDALFNRAERNARVKAARARAASGGMGHRPMVDSSRSTFPHQGAGGELERESQAIQRPPQAHGSEGRVVKRSEDPRPQNQDQASPDSCLKDKRAEGVPALRCGHGGSDDSGEVPSTSEELTLAPFGHQSAMRGA